MELPSFKYHPAPLATGSIVNRQAKCDCCGEIRDYIYTPGFCSWQCEKWLVHCNDACVFLGPAGRRKIEAIGSRELIDSLREDIEMDEKEFEGYFKALDKESEPTAYIFRCLHCSVCLGFSDFT